MKLKNFHLVFSINILFSILAIIKLLSFLIFSFHIAFGSADHCVHYYDIRKADRALQIYKGHKKAVSYVKFLDSTTLVSASTDSQLKLWKCGSGNSSSSPNFSFSGHQNEKNFVGLATDGDYIACGSEDNSLYVYYKGLLR